MAQPLVNHRQTNRRASPAPCHHKRIIRSPRAVHFFNTDNGLGPRTRMLPRPTRAQEDHEAQPAAIAGPERCPRRVPPRRRPEPPKTRQTRTRTRPATHLMGPIQYPETTKRFYLDVEQPQNQNTTPLYAYRRSRKRIHQPILSTLSGNSGRSPVAQREIIEKFASQARDSLTGRIVGAISLRDRPLLDRTHALANTACGLGPSRSISEARRPW